MVCAGLSAVSAIWNTIWMRRSSSRERGLARTRFADHAERLPAPQLEAHIVEHGRRRQAARAGLAIARD